MLIVKKKKYYEYSIVRTSGRNKDGGYSGNTVLKFLISDEKDAKDIINAFKEFNEEVEFDNKELMLRKT